MELFVVRHNSGKVVKSNLNSKMEAKAIRKALHLADGIKEEEVKDKHTEFTYHVSRGKDHPDVRREANLQRF
jgi:hypothetical protein